MSGAARPTWRERWRTRAVKFVMRVPAPGRYATRVLRIGFRPTRGPVVDVGANDTVRVRIVSRGEAIVLSAVNVRDKETCRVGADSGVMVARGWGEARQAMLEHRNCRRTTCRWWPIGSSTIACSIRPGTSCGRNA